MNKSHPGQKNRKPLRESKALDREGRRKIKKGYERLREIREKRRKKDEEVELLAREVQALKRIVKAAKEKSTPSTPIKKEEQGSVESKRERKRERREKVKEEGSWYEMSPDEEKGAITEMKGRNREQRMEDNTTLRTATMADMMRRVTELAMGIRGKKEDERDEQFVNRLESQMKKSMDPD